MKKTDKENSRESNGSKDRKNWLEWIVFGLSVLLVLAILGYLVYQVYTEEPSTPDLIVEIIADPSEQAPYRYHVTIHNKGGTTAEEVMVEVALDKDGNTIEKAELQIPFVPQESKRESWVIFSKDPALADTLAARVISYKKP